MRRGSGTETMYHDGKLVAIALGADYCAEHEGGLDGIRMRLGVQQDGIGVSRRQISKHEFVHFKRLNKTTKAILYCASYKNDEIVESVIGKRWNKEDSFVSAWSERDFGLASFTKDSSNDLEELHQAFLRHDVAIWSGNCLPAFGRAPLCIGIISRLSKDLRQEMEDFDRKQIAFKEKVEAIEKESGLKEKLHSAGKRWFALSPSDRIINKMEEETKYDIIYWLNPMDQKHNRFGWVTVEDLLDWAEDKGCIPHPDNSETYAGGVSKYTDKYRR